MDGIHDDDADNDNDNDNNHRILNEQLKWFTIYNELDKFNRIAMLIRENDQFNPLLIPAPTKKASTSRLCGTKLVDAIIKLCNGCVKPVGGKAVSVKRSLRALMKRGETLTEKCCINRCSFEDMKSFCCD